MTELLSPVQPHEMGKKWVERANCLIARIVRAAAHQGIGQDLLLRIYLTGMYHGVELSKQIKEPDPHDY